MVEAAPWDYYVTPEQLEKVRAMPKPKRREFAANPKTEWSIYSGVGGVAPNLRVSDENPPSRLRAIVADYDIRMSLDAVCKFLDDAKPTYMPTFAEKTISGNARLVWMFERELLLADMAHAKAVIEAFAQELKISTILPGFDNHSLSPAEVWTNGCEWAEFESNPIPWNNIFGILCRAAKKTNFGSDPEIPYEVLLDEINLRFPGRWKGPFKLDELGVRFWDPQADNATGCQVKPDGMLCFTGNTPFLKWRQIFGPAWVAKNAAENLGQRASDFYFDGMHYWQPQGAGWDRIKRREDMLCILRTRGFSTKIPKGETASDADRVLTHIQKVNRLAGAAPFVNYAPGLIQIRGKRFLNITQLTPLLPADASDVTPADFPFLWKFLNGIFARPELGAVNYFLAWAKRSYETYRDHSSLMGQAVFLCGPRENGKTLISSKILEPLLGNSSANPYDYFTGATPFNSELLESFLLTINDEEAVTDHKSKSKFLARIKAWVVNPTHPYSPKYCDRTPVDWTGRIFCTLNDDHSSVGLLPEVNDNTADKMMFFGSRPFEGHWPERSVIESTVAAELPYFARWLLEWSPPENVVISGRMGVVSFFDRRVLRFCLENTKAYSLLEFLQLWIKDAPYWSEGAKMWTGTATDLLSDLSNVPHHSVLLREWDSYRVAQALTALSRVVESGVKLEKEEANSTRTFTLHRELVLKTPLNPHEEEEKH